MSQAFLVPYESPQELPLRNQQHDAPLGCLTKSQVHELTTAGLSEKLASIQQLFRRTGSCHLPLCMLKHLSPINSWDGTAVKSSYFTRSANWTQQRRPSTTQKLQDVTVSERHWEHVWLWAPPAGTAAPGGDKVFISQAVCEAVPPSTTRETEITMQICQTRIYTDLAQSTLLKLCSIFQGSWGKERHKPTYNKKSLIY